YGGASRADARDRQGLQIGGVGQRHFFRVHAQRRGVQVVEGVLDHTGDHFGAHAHRTPALFGRDQAVGLLDALDDGLVVLRTQGANVDDLDRNALAGQLFGVLQGGADHAAVGRDRHVRTFASNLGHADRNDVVLDVRDVELVAVHHLVFEEDDRVRVADRRLKQSLGIGGVIGRYGLRARDLSVPGGIVLDVLGRYA